MNKQSIKRGFFWMFAWWVGAAGGLLAKTKDTSQIPLTEVGQKLEVRYTQQLEVLREEITRALPAVNPQKKEAFLKAREVEKMAIDRLKAAQKRMGEINTAKALVGHAKGKWIGGAKQRYCGSTRYAQESNYGSRA